MNIKIISVLLSIIICSSLYSCSNEDGDGGYARRRDQENAIMFRVYSNTPDVPITISEFYGGTLIIKDSWKGEYITKQYSTQFAATCKDETVLITGEVYVNGKLKLKKDGNKYIRLIVKDVKR